jgi:hypothetical protein
LPILTATFSFGIPTITESEKPRQMEPLQLLQAAEAMLKELERMLA